MLHAIGTELRSAETDFPSLVPAIQSIINNSPSRRLGDRAPITVHTGMRNGNPLSVALAIATAKNVSDLNEAEMMQRLNISDLLNSLDEMHRDTANRLETNRNQAVDRHNRKTHVRNFNPVVGDYVVVARIHGPRTKVSANWVGPRRICEICSDFTVKVEHLLTHKQEVVHISRVRPYRDADVGSTVQLEEVAEFADRVWHSVDCIKDLRETNSVFEVLVSWKGLSTSGDTWEPLLTMFEDVPTKVRAFFKKKRASGMINRAKASIAL